MKILVLSSYLDTLTAVRPEGEMLIAAHQTGRVTIDVMTQANAPFVQRFRAVGMRVIDFHPAKKFDRAAVAFIRSVLFENKYDLLHLFNNKAIVNGIRAARGLPIKVATYRGVVGNVNWYDPTAYLTHLHPCVDGITALSPAVNVYLKGQLWHNSKVVETVIKGQHADWFKRVQPTDLQRFSIKKEDFVVACVANVRKVKGIPDLITATQFLPSSYEWHLLLVGKGMDSPKIQRLIDRSPRWVHFYCVGFQKEVLPYIAASDLYVQPSRMEGLGKTVQEAMMLEKPVVATAVGGLRDLIKDGKTGLAVPPKAPHQLAAALTKMRVEEALRQQLAAAGKRWIEQHFSVAHSAEQLIAFYQKLLTIRP